MVLEVLNCGKQRLGTSIILDGLCGGLSIIALVCISTRVWAWVTGRTEITRVDTYIS